MTYVVLGLFAGAAYGLIAIGFVFINSVIDAYPFQQGSMVVLYSYLFLYTYQWTGNGLVSSALLLVAAVVTSLTVSRLAFEPLLGRHFPSLVAGLGISIVIDEIAGQYFFFGQPVAYPSALKLSGSVTLAGVDIDYNRAAVFLFAVGATVLLDQFFQWTRPGMQMRAVADSPPGAQLCAINVRWSIRSAFVLAGVSGAVAGVLLGLLQSTISPQLGGALTIKGLAAAMLGGGTSLRGAIVGAFVIAVSENIAIGYMSSSFAQVVAYVIIVGILFMRPQGLLGRHREARA